MISWSSMNAYTIAANQFGNRHTPLCRMGTDGSAQKSVPSGTEHITFHIICGHVYGKQPFGGLKPEIFNKWLLSWTSSLGSLKPFSWWNIWFLRFTVSDVKLVNQSCVPPQLPTEQRKGPLALRHSSDLDWWSLHSKPWEEAQQKYIQQIDTHTRDMLSCCVVILKYGSCNRCPKTDIVSPAPPPPTGSPLPVTSNEYHVKMVLPLLVEQTV